MMMVMMMVMMLMLMVMMMIVVVASGAVWFLFFFSFRVPIILTEAPFCCSCAFLTAISHLVANTENTLYLTAAINTPLFLFNALTRTIFYSWLGGVVGID